MTFGRLDPCRSRGVKPKSVGFLIELTSRQLCPGLAAHGVCCYGEPVAGEEPGNSAEIETMAKKRLARTPTDAI